MSFMFTKIKDTCKGKKNHGKVVRYENSERCGQNQKLRTGEKTEGPECMIESACIGSKNTGNYQNPVEISGFRPGKNGKK